MNKENKYGIVKYPRTPHLEGSRLQAGDEDLSQVPFASIQGKRIVVTEKCDGANSAISFDENGAPLPQSRGHYLLGGYREKHYHLFKKWVHAQREALFGVLGSRYILYGEWLYAKHTVFYDHLPHYFLEFDIFDRETGIFLDTPTRRQMLRALPVVSVPVLKSAPFGSLGQLTELVGPSTFIRDGHIQRLCAYCDEAGGNAERCRAETDPTTLMEGLYIKVENNGMVTDRMKYVRGSFLQCVESSNSHWLSRPIVPNQLLYPMEAIFAPALPDAAMRMKDE